jgi:hypothetical protein
VNRSEFANQNLYRYFINGTPTLLEPLPQAILSETGLRGTHGTPNFLLFFYKAIGDELSPINNTNALVFLKDRFDGVPASTGCSTTNVSSTAFNLAAIEALGVTVADSLSALLSQPIEIL